MVINHEEKQSAISVRYSKKDKIKYTWGHGSEDGPCKALKKQV